MNPRRWMHRKSPPITIPGRWPTPGCGAFSRPITSPVSGPGASWNLETLTGETAPVVVNIFGDDLDVLDRKAQEVARVVQAVPGAADVRVKSPPGVPRIAVRLRPERLTQFGFRPVEVLASLDTAYQGTVAAQTHRGNQVTDVVVTLFGITMRNSIMMISHFEHLVTAERMPWGLAAAVRGATERLMPILMTATLTGLGLLPLALGTGEAGREIEGLMAIVILGGLATSTLLNLFVLPNLAVRYGRFESNS